MKNPLFIALLALGFTGCASTTDLPSGYAMDASRKEGLAIASFTLSGKTLDQYSDFEFRIREATPKTDEAVVTKRHFGSAAQHAKWAASGPARDVLDWPVIVKGARSSAALDIGENGIPKGRLVFLRLPAGEYELYTWKLRETDAFGRVEHGPSNSFSYRFRVNPGSATYLGQLDLRIDGKGAAMTVSDRRARDFALIRQKMPAIDSAQIHADVRQIEP